jgi:hypothetical protein
LKSLRTFGEGGNEERGKREKGREKREKGREEGRGNSAK